MRIRCIVSYDGTHFRGWQIQPNQRTVQGVIQDALKQITQEDVIIHSSGRTDAGVHGVNQVFHFDTNKELPEKQWKRAINHFMPEDIYIKDTKLVTEEFHSRYSAKEKEYRYLLSMNEYDPFQVNYIYQYGRTLDIEAMRECAKIFIGEHDFASFCTYDQYGNTIRTLYRFDIDEKDGIVTFKLIGNGFRRYMVRHLVGGLIQVGAHRRDQAFIQALLDSKGENKCLFKAKPQGLYLWQVTYDDEH
ncbi:MAG: tRNA pseudouridine(38-40) synthase TruA [Erysipelotrichaceae bacterium]|nr:tRNA pseudouridine(38-40) synthase TruA [Erysipelotrichaceae bacterium]